MQKQLFTRLICLLVLALGTVAFSVGCNTMEGAGKDVQATGEAIQDGAD